MFKEVEAEPGYAKIEGPNNFHHIIKCLRVYLGRKCSKGFPNEDILPSEEFYGISENPKISKRHLLLYYDENKMEWFAKNLSKNSVYINKKPLTEYDQEICISPISAIEINELKFYFFQAKPKV